MYRLVATLPIGSWLGAAALPAAAFLEFGGCMQGRMVYQIPSFGEQGSIPIERIALDNLVTCENSQQDPDLEVPGVPQ